MVLGFVHLFSISLFVLQEGLDDESFESFKSGLVAKLLEKDPTLSYETDRYWNQIVDKRYMICIAADITRCFHLDCTALT